ncbi:helix-hairpin-helix domain-containing protein, partial [Paludisphaera sp.]|uniref:helix-hairpin-helix domain-containing protein n=1 Tax=Paludisphaera sp. TaxID=2017432 RepID=UPI00301D3CF4
IEKAVAAFSRIEGVDVELAERLVEQGILSYDDLSVMEIADLVATIEGLDEELAESIVAQAETMAEEQTEDLPRRKSGRNAAALADGQGQHQPPADGEPAPEGAELQDASDENEPALPAEPRDEFESEPEGDVAEAGDDYDADRADPDDADGGDESPRDLALAEEGSDRPADNGREVTSRPDDADQDETARLVTDVVVNREDPPSADADADADAEPATGEADDEES